MAKTLYEILGVSEMATKTQLSTAFKALEHAYTLQNDQQAYEALNRAREAFRILSNPAQRSAYDQQLLAKRLDGIGLEEMAEPSVWALRKNSALSFIQKPAVLAFVALLVALFVYWSIESRRMQHEERIYTAAEQAEMAKTQLLAEQRQLEAAREDERLRMQQEWQANAFESEQRLRMQALNNAQFNAERQMSDAEEAADRAWQQSQKRLDLETRSGELALAEQKTRLKYLQPQLELDLRNQRNQAANQVLQRSLEQHDEAIAAMQGYQQSLVDLNRQPGDWQRRESTR